MERQTAVGEVARPATRHRKHETKFEKITKSIDRKFEVKKEFQEYLNDSCGEYQSKYRMAIQSLKVEPCDDAVSRQAVRHILNHEIKMPIKVWKKLFKLVDDLPSVKPQDPEWIPINKKLPDKEGQYLVTVQSSSLGVNSMELANFSLDLSNVSCLFRHEKGRSGWWGCDDGGWNVFIYSGVIAWMPLPKPYKPQERSTRHDGC